MEHWLMHRRPTLYLSLHPMYASHSQVNRAVEVVRRIYPYVWEGRIMQSGAKMIPFDFEKHNRSHYKGGDHGGTDLLGTFYDVRAESASKQHLRREGP